MSLVVLKPVCTFEKRKEEGLVLKKIVIHKPTSEQLYENLSRVGPMQNL